MPAPIAAAYFHEELLKKQQLRSTTDEFPAVTVVAAHEGQVFRAAHLRSVLRRLSGQRIELAILSKNKLSPGDTRSSPSLIGDVKGRTCIIVDDIVTTGTTMVNSINKLHEEGAGSIYAWATHGVFGSGEASTSSAPDRIANAQGLEYLLISNSVTNSSRILPDKIRQLNVAPLLAEAVARSLHGQSISSILNMDHLDHVVEEGDENDGRYDG